MIMNKPAYQMNLHEIKANSFMRAMEIQPIKSYFLTYILSIIFHFLIYVWNIVKAIIHPSIVNLYRNFLIIQSIAETIFFLTQTQSTHLE